MSNIALINKPKLTREKIKIPTPFLKWVGGKAQMLKQYEEFFPKSFNRYIEPMVGGGAVFYHLFNTERITDGVTLIDISQELINCYSVVKNNVGELIDELKELKFEYDQSPEKVYYEVRKWDREKNWGKRSDLIKATRTIFLNKTCFNGLYRVNSKGQFNTPIGRYSNPNICDEVNLMLISNALQNVELLNSGFENTLQIASKGDFIYFDPPYHPLNETAYFTSYTNNGFSKDDQVKLKDTFKKLAEKGCKVMLSNSDTDFTNQIYKDFNINKVYANRYINSNSDKRGKISEIVITNYKT